MRDPLVYPYTPTPMQSFCLFEIGAILLPMQSFCVFQSGVIFFTFLKKCIQ